MPIQRLALGTRKGLLIVERDSSDDPSSWSLRHHAFRGSHVSIVFHDQRSSHLFACLDDGHFGNKLFRWNEFGRDSNWRTVAAADAWQELTAPAYPTGSRLADGSDAVLRYQWAMAAGSPQQPGRIYLGSEPGGLFVSDDDGDHFSLVQSLWDHPSRTDKDMPWMGGGRDHPAIHSVVVDPRNQDRVLIGVSVAGVFRSDDGLQTWNPANLGLRADFLPNPYPEVGHDPHLLAHCPEQPDVLWQQNHCGIFRSIDGGNQWSDVSQAGGPANFGFAVAVDAHDGDVAWVVPAESDQVRVACDQRQVVCRTEDGGQSWQAFGTGLPQHGCFDFAFRHCLVNHENELIFATAGGSLYHSSDRGESWQSIFHHLPPVYCVHTIDAD